MLSGLGYVAVFRMVFCRRMTWRVSYQIGMSELGANALFPTGGAGGLALGAWALKRGGMPADEIARRSVAFFLLTSVPNVVGVIVVGIGLATAAVSGRDQSGADRPAGRDRRRRDRRSAARRAHRPANLHRRLEAQRRRRYRRRRTSVALKTLVAVADGVNEAVALLREGNAWLICGLIAYLVFDVMILWATFRAFGAAPPLAIVWIAYLIGELGGLIPVPGGIGGVDAGLVGTLVLYHVPITSATSAVLAYRAIALWVPAVLGAGAFVALRRTLRDESCEDRGLRAADRDGGDRARPRRHRPRPEPAWPDPPLALGCRGCCPPMYDGTSSDSRRSCGARPPTGRREAGSSSPRC